MEFTDFDDIENDYNKPTYLEILINAVPNNIASRGVKDAFSEMFRFYYDRFSKANKRQMMIITHKFNEKIGDNDITALAEFLYGVYLDGIIFKLKDRERLLNELHAKIVEYVEYKPDYNNRIQFNLANINAHVK